MLKLLIATAVFAHGIGHVLFLAPTLRFAAWADQTGHSWALAPLLGDGLSRIVGALLWSLAIGLFIGAVGGFLMGLDWWRGAAIAGAIVSAIGIVVMWDGLTVGSAALALAFDAVVLVALLWANWPSVEVAGS